MVEMPEQAMLAELREAANLPACLRAFSGLACRLTGAEICLVCLHDDIHDLLRCMEIVFPPKMEHLRSAYIRFVYPENSDNFRVFSSRQAINVHSEQRAQCSASAQLAFDFWQARQMVILPLTRNDHPICSGTVMLMAQNRDIDAAKIALLETVIVEAFMLLHLHMHTEVWAERVASLRSAEAEIDGMLKFVAETSHQADIHVIHHSVLKEFLARFDLDFGALWVPDGRLLRCVATEAPADKPVWMEFWQKGCEGVVLDSNNARDAAVSYVFSTGHPMLFGDVEAMADQPMPDNDRFFLSGMPGLQTLFLQPIRHKSGVTGVLLLVSLKRKHALSSRDQEQIGYWADFLGAMLTNASTAANLRQTHEALMQSKKLSALGSIVVAVAHELNTPIGNALTINSTLEARNEELINEIQAGLRRSILDRYVGEAQHATGLISRNLSRAARIISDFKEIAIDRNNVDRQEFDASKVVDEVARHVELEYREIPVTLQIELEGDTWCDSYRGPLSQVIFNLVANAYRHAFDGREGGELQVRLVEHDADNLCLTIADDGTGIPDDVIDRIFDPFFTGKLGQGNSGLGLFVVHNIVTAILGGRIDVNSHVGQGTAFSVTFPKIAPGEVSLTTESSAV